MDNNANSPIEVKLTLPQSATVTDFSFKKLVKLLVSKRKFIFIVTLVFLLLGVLTAYLYSLKAKDIVVTNATSSIVISIKDDSLRRGLAKDGSAFDKNSLVSMDIVEAAKLAAGIDPSIDIASHLSVEDIIPPDVAGKIEAYRGLVAQDKNYLVRIAETVYFPTSFKITLSLNDELSQLEDATSIFLKKIAEENNKEFTEISIRNIDLAFKKVKKTYEDNDYPLAVRYLAKELTNFLSVIPNDSTPIIERRIQLTAELDKLTKEITTKRATKNKDDLLKQISYLLEVKNLNYLVSKEKAAYMTGVSLEGTTDNSASVSLTINDKSSAAINSINEATQLYSDILYLEYLQKLYSEPLIENNVDYSIKNYIDEMSEFSDYVKDSLSYVTSSNVVNVPAQLSQVNANNSKLIIIIVGFAFLGLFFALIIVLGKALIIDK